MMNLPIFCLIVQRISLYFAFVFIPLQLQGDGAVAENISSSFGENVTLTTAWRAFDGANVGSDTTDQSPEQIDQPTSTTINSSIDSLQVIYEERIEKNGQTGVEVSGLAAASENIEVALVDPRQTEQPSLESNSNSWIAQTGFWQTESNWSLGVLPTLIPTEILITNDGPKIISIDSATASSFSHTLTVNDLVVSERTGETSMLALMNAGKQTPLHVLNSFEVSSGGKLAISNAALRVGNDLSDTFLIKGAALFENDAEVVITNSSKTATMTIAGNGSLQVTGGDLLADRMSVESAVEIVGGNTTLTEHLDVQGSLTVANSTVVLEPGSGFRVDGSLGVLSGDVSGIGVKLLVGNTMSGAVTVDGGNIKVESLQLSGGVLTVMSSGTVESLKGVEVANTADRHAAIQLLGGNIVSPYVTVASAGTGGLTLSGGTLIVTNGVLGIGNNGSADGGSGEGNLSVSDGVVFAKEIVLGSNHGGRGTLDLNGTGIIEFDNCPCSLTVNAFYQNGGDLVITNGTVFVGKGHPGELTLTNGMMDCQDVYVGYDDKGICTITSGTMQITDRLTIGHEAGSTGHMVVNGGELVITNSPTIIGNLGFGTLVLSNGTVHASNVTVSKQGEPSVLTLAGGTLNVESLSLPNENSQFIFNQGNLSARSVAITNNQVFAVGDGFNSAALKLLGGDYGFKNGLLVANKGIVTGCGTITGSIINYGTIITDCQSDPLTIGGVLTNQNMIVVSKGSTIQFDSLVVNEGVIDAREGFVSFGSGFVNNGTLMLDPEGDADNDSLPNSWEETYGLNPLSAKGHDGPKGDPDKDRQGNLQEMTSGTNPNDSKSLFKVLGVERQGKDIMISWSTVGNRSYVVQTNSSVKGTTPSKFTNLSPVIYMPGTSESTTNYVDFGGGTNSPPRLYRVRIVR